MLCVLKCSTRSKLSSARYCRVRRRCVYCRTSECSERVNSIIFVSFVAFLGSIKAKLMACHWHATKIIGMPLVLWHAIGMPSVCHQHANGMPISHQTNSNRFLACHWHATWHAKNLILKLKIYLACQWHADGIPMACHQHATWHANQHAGWHAITFSI